MDSSEWVERGLYTLEGFGADPGVQATVNPTSAKYKVVEMVI